MSSLQEICSGLPIDPLPSKCKQRDNTVPHAPVRTPHLSAEEELVGLALFIVESLTLYPKNFGR